MPVLLMLLFSASCMSPPTSEQESLAAPKTKQGESKNISIAHCVDIRGSYVMRGVALPGMSDYFMIRSFPLTLDLMLGTELTREEREIISRVDLVQNQTGIELSFMQRNNIAIQRKLAGSNLVISCDNERVTILKSVRTTGEAMSGTAKIEITLTLAEDRSLVVRVVRQERNRTLVFFWSDHEEYAARFARINQ